MKSVIPFTKNLEFKTKISEITSISLEREFKLEKEEITGNLFVTGEYKSHDISANILPFSYKIPFSIEVPDNIKKEDLTLEITDFAYDIQNDKEITVNVELELCYSLEEKEEEEETPPLVNSDEMIAMMEERNESSDEIKDEVKEELVEREIKKEPEKEALLETEKVEQSEVEKKKTENRNESEDLIMNTALNDDEYTTYHIHIVKEGETVETICSLYNTNLNFIKNYNDVESLTLGSKIIIPTDDES